MFQLRSVRKIIFFYCSPTFRSRVSTSGGILYGKQQLCFKILSDGCYARYQGVVVVVAQLNINSDHFAQRHKKKDVQKQETQDLSRCQG